MSSPLVHEKIWFEKGKYDEAQYYENLAKGSPNTPNKNSLPGELANTQQIVRNILKCMDGISALATENVEVNRFNILEKDNAEPKKYVDDLKAIISKSESRIEKLESHGKSGDASPLAICGASVAKTASAAPAAKPVEVDEDDNMDLCSSDSEEENMMPNN
jgi:hypothetical protein